MKTAIILRGLPGSGKSTVANLLGVGYSDVPNPPKVIHSTDSYFYDKDGNYNFDPNMLKVYHPQNLTAFTNSCKAGIGLVILDNTNTEHWEYEKYVEVAEENGYQVHIITVGDFNVEHCVERNTHGVPMHAINRMKQRWQR